MLITVQYPMASAMPTPIPPIAPLRPIVTPNGTASSVITTTTNGNASFRASATCCGTTWKPLAASTLVWSRSSL